VGIGIGGVCIGPDGAGKTCSVGGNGKLNDGQFGHSSGHGRQHVL
jgi:hypothetical protein